MFFSLPVVVLLTAEAPVIHWALRIMDIFVPS